MKLEECKILFEAVQNYYASNNVELMEETLQKELQRMESMISLLLFEFFCLNSFVLLRKTTKQQNNNLFILFHPFSSFFILFQPFSSKKAEKG